jgi:hypothetical protein
VTQEEQHIVDQISWEITSWHQTTNEISGEIKMARENIGKMKEQLKGMRETRDLTDKSAEYAINNTLCKNGVDQKVYHGQCLIGPQIMKLTSQHNPNYGATGVEAPDRMCRKCCEGSDNRFGI